MGIIKGGRITRATWEYGRSFNQTKVENLAREGVAVLEDGSPPCVVVSKVVTREKKQGRPTPLNTVAFLKACSKGLGIGPHAALSTAERLYLSGYLSYPRTESSAYPSSFDIKGTLKLQADDPRWGTYVRDLLKAGPNGAKGGYDAGDHPPITPCRGAGVHELGGDMSRVYELVVRHFIATVSPDAVWMSTKVGLEIPPLGEKGLFSVMGKQLVSPGFLAVLLHKQYGEKERVEGMRDEEDELDDAEERQLPDFKEGERLPLHPPEGSKGKGGGVGVVATGARATLGVKERMTVPPTHLTESELIGMMEKNGIGTDASIPTHIENILKRNYAQLITGRKLMPTKLGLVLANGYHLIDSALVLPKVRADIEGQCDEISKGVLRKEDVVQRSLELFEGKFINFMKNIGKMDVLFGSR